ncbi:MAG: IS1182 family transposase [Saprospiraceae bacterium]
MNYIIGQDRLQLEFVSLEDRISKDNAVRFIDAFVEEIDLNKLGFVVKTIKSEGRPAYDSKMFLKIYLYGYLNRLRSSRSLERECSKNLELQWLTCNLQPNYHSIADFRKLNPKALKALFRLYVSFLRDIELVGGPDVIIATDGTKIRGKNSKKNNYTQKKVDRHIKYNEEKTNEYLRQLEQNDREDKPIPIIDIEKKLEHLKKNKIKYDNIQEALNTSEDKQVSTTDEDCRLLKVQGLDYQVGYNTQTAVDSKYKLIVATQTINETDINALADISIEAKKNLEVESLTNIADKGYHNAEQLQKCKEEGITTIVAPREIANSKDKGTTPEYLVDKFIYDKETDSYTCPAGKILTTNGEWYEVKKEGKKYKCQKYRTEECKTCPVKHLCTSGKTRIIERKEYTQSVEENNKRYRDNQALYKTRQELIEHVFGTMKRGWGYNYTNLKGLEKVNGEMALIMTVYNIRRCITIIGIENMIDKLRKWTPDYRKVALNHLKQALLSTFWGSQTNRIKIAA